MLPVGGSLLLKVRPMVDELFFFDRKPGTLPLYEAVRHMICKGFDDVTIKVSKTQIAFANKHQFAFVSLPYRKIKGAPDVYILLTFGLERKEDHPRIAVSTEPYPGRWTHHVVIASVDDVDEQVREWINEAYHFARIKGIRRKRS